MLWELKYLFRKFVRNNKGIEAMPMKYLIILLIAAVMIGIIAYMLTTLKSGSQHAVTEINKTVSEKVTEGLQQLGS